MSLEAPSADRSDFASAADYAYAALRQAIVAGEFQPGRRMREIALSEWLGVSRTPVRQALSRLEVEGLLEVLPRAGLVVASLDDGAMAELYDMREALEGTAAHLAARNAGPRDIETLESLVELERALPDETAVLYRHNLRFHQALHAAAHNRYLLKSLQALHDALALLGPTTLSSPERLREARREHRRIVAAIARRDPRSAEAEARAHIRNGFPVRRAMRAKRAEAP